MLVGILGGGQLGRMLALAGIPIGFTFRFLDPSPDAPAADVAEHVAADYDDQSGLSRLAEGVDVVTYEFENVPVEAARSLAALVPVFPPPLALEAAQDRLEEKALFDAVGIPSPAHLAVGTREELDAALGELGAPAVLKSRRLGYDGKGQVVLRSVEDIPTAWGDAPPAGWILEELVEFERELSIIGVRGRGGQTMFYPLIENLHEDGILRRSLAPAPGVSVELQTRAEALSMHVLDELDYVGVLAIELFQVGERLLANEMAPRVHNSGHWTIEGAETSQFENHLRAIAGLPLGSTAMLGHAGMLNLIGSVPEAAGVLAVTGAHFHRYGKAARAGRKLGHITVRTDHPDALEAALESLQGLLD